MIVFVDGCKKHQTYRTIRSKIGKHKPLIKM